MFYVFYYLSKKQQKKKMSHLIENTVALESEPILQPLTKEIVVPNLTHQHLTSLNLSTNENHRRKLRFMFDQWTREENHIYQLQNERYMRKQLERLKVKLANRAKLEKIHENQPPKERSQKSQLASKLRIKQHHKVDLMKKYKPRISQKIKILEQAENIQKDRDLYKSWYNQNHNSPLKSPIYSKMTYLLQRINKKNMTSEIDSQSSHPKKKDNYIIPNTTVRRFKDRKYDLSLCF